MVKYVRRIRGELEPQKYALTEVARSPYGQPITLLEKESRNIFGDIGGNAERAGIQKMTRLPKNKASRPPLKEGFPAQASGGLASIYASLKKPVNYAYVAAVPKGAEEKAGSLVESIRSELNKKKNEKYNPDAIKLLSQEELEELKPGLATEIQGRIGWVKRTFDRLAKRRQLFIVYHLKNEQAYDNLLREIGQGKKT